MTSCKPINLELNNLNKCFLYAFCQLIVSYPNLTADINKKIELLNKTEQSYGGFLHELQ
jgi:hypothetical protein